MVLSEILKLKFPAINLVSQVRIQDDGQGPYIAKWDDSLGPQPDQAQLDQWAVELAPVKFELDQRENRRAEYPAIGDQLDAIMKYLDTKNDLTPELGAVKQQWKDTKAKYPLVQS